MTAESCSAPASVSSAARSCSARSASPSPSRRSLRLLDPALTTRIRNCGVYMSAWVSDAPPAATPGPGGESGHTQPRTSGESSPT